MVFGKSAFLPQMFGRYHDTSSHNYFTGLYPLVGSGGDYVYFSGETTTAGVPSMTVLTSTP